MFASGALRRAAPLMAVLCTLAFAGSASAETLRAAPSASLVDSVGVNIHPIFLDTAYKDGDRVVSTLKGLGIRHVRHGIHASPDPKYAWINQYNRDFAAKLAAAGMRSDLIVGNPDDSSGTIAQQLAEVRDHLANVAESIEGSNEWDGTGRVNWAAEVRAYQQALYAGVKADPKLRSLPVIAPSLAQWKRVTILGDLSASADYGNLHAYPGGLEPSDTFLDDQLTAERTVTGSKPVMITETGYHNAMAYGGGHRPTSERAAGIYMPRLLLEHFRRGIPRTWLYELIDERLNTDNTNAEAHFGLLRNDWSEKPAATALRNLLSI